MEIHPSGSRPSRRAPADWFTGTVWQDPILDSAGAGARALLRRALRAGRAYELAYASARADAVHRLRHGPRSELGRALAAKCSAGDVVWIPPGEKHWHGATPANDHGAHRHRGNTRRQICRMAGESDGSAVHDWRIALCATPAAAVSGGPGQASVCHGTVTGVFQGDPMPGGSGDFEALAAPSHFRGRCSCRMLERLCSRQPLPRLR
jgi:hypothetical protein